MQVVPGVQMLPFEIGQAYIWDWGAGLTVVDSGVVRSADAILAAVAALGRSPRITGASARCATTLAPVLAASSAAPPR